MTIHSLTQDSPTLEARFLANHVKETIQAILPNNWVTVRTGILGGSELFIKLASCPAPSPNDTQGLSFLNARTTGTITIDASGIRFDYFTIKAPDGTKVKPRSRKGTVEESLAYLVKFIETNKVAFSY